MNIADAPEVGDNSGTAVKKDRNAFFRSVVKLGETEGTGRDALIKVGFASQEAAANGLISLDKDPHTKQDDAQLISEKFVEGSGRAGQYSTSGSKKVQASKLRAFIKLGLHGPSDGGLDTSARFVKLHKEAVTQKSNVYPAFEAAVAMARVQCKTDRALTDDEIVESIQKQSKADKDAVEVAESIRKMLEKLISGERPDGVQTQHQKVLDAESALADYVKEMTVSNQQAQVMEMAAALGMTFVQA
jgi:hypothetical protein